VDCKGASYESTTNAGAGASIVWTYAITTDARATARNANEKRGVRASSHARERESERASERKRDRPLSEATGSVGGHHGGSRVDV
jgi:hypothetical protein